MDTVKPGADGVFVFGVRPTVGARYRATTAATQLRSADVHVRVTPMVSQIVSSRSTVIGQTVVVKARISPASAARRAVLMRFVPSRKLWVTVASGPVRAGG